MRPDNKNILFIHNTYRHQGGEDTVVANEMDALRKTNYNIYYKKYNNISFQQPGVKSLLLPLHLFFNLFSFLNIFFFIKKNKIAIVHVHNIFYAASPSVLWAAKLAGAMTVMTIHNYRLFCLNAYFFRDGQICYQCQTNQNFKKGISEKCFKSSRLFSTMLAWSTIFHRKIGSWQFKVDQFIVLNEFTRQLLTTIRVASEKIILKPNFLPHSVIYNDYLDREDFYLFAGRLSEEKGIRPLLNAFSQLPYKLIIAGEGDLVKLVKEYVCENIIYIGHQNQHQMQNLLHKCKALLFPSLWIEGMPMTIIEAQASGTIPIVARSTNTEQMIGNGKDGYLYEARNIDSLKEIITSFEKKGIDELNKISNNAHQKFLRTYQEAQHIEAIAGIYEGLLSYENE